MHSLLEQYLTDIRFPELSGAEHLQVLHTRDRIAESDIPLTPEERVALYRKTRENPIFQVGDESRHKATTIGIATQS